MSTTTVSNQVVDQLQRRRNRWLARRKQRQPPAPANAGEGSNIESPTATLQTSGNIVAGSTVHRQSQNIGTAVQSPTPPVTIWQEVLDSHFSKLDVIDRAYILRGGPTTSLDQAHLDDFVRNLSESYGRKPSTSAMAKIYPIMSHIQSFGRVLDTLVQYNPIAILVWGSVRLLLEISTRTFRLHEKILNTLETLSTYLSLFETWRRLFPEESHLDLSTCMRNTCVEFVAFVVEAIKFLRRGAFTNALRTIFLPSFEAEFKSAEEKIQRQTRYLDLQVATAGLQSFEDRHRIIYGMLQSTSVPQSSQQTSQSPLKLPFRFTTNCVRNNKFFGRADVLGSLEKSFERSSVKKNNSRLQSTVLYGHGGFGKSSVALEYMYRHYDEYPVVLWFYADKQDKLDTQFHQLARVLDLTVESGNITSTRQVVQHWITHLDVDWLLVFDNADDASLLTDYWPASKHGSIIITSRNPFVGMEGFVSQCLQLMAFQNDQGAEFLLSLLDNLENPSEADVEALKSISGLFHGFPLGLRQAGYFMRSKNCLPSAFIDLYKNHHQEIEQFKLSGYSKTTADVWDISIGTLKQDAMNLLDLLTFLDPDRIPVELFQKFGCKSPFTEFLGDTMRYLNASGQLADQSLIDINLTAGTISLHRFFQDSTYRRLQKAPTRLENVFHAAVDIINLALPEDDYLSMKHLEAWKAFEAYLDHAEMLLKRSTDINPPHGLGSLLNIFTKVSGYYHETAQYSLCEALLEKAKKIAVEANVVDNEALSKVYYYHGRLCQETNKPAIAVQDFEQATQLFETAARSNDSLRDSTFLAILYENLGMSYTGAGQYSEAEVCLKKAIEIGRNPDARTHIVLGDFMQCLGACYLWKGDLEQAEDILCKALLNKCGADNENRGGALYTLGNVYLRQRKYHEGLRLHQEVLQMYTKDLGNEHHWVADSCVKVGSIFAIRDFESRDLVKAEELLRKSLEIWQSPKNHRNLHSEPSMIRTKWGLGQILSESGGDHLGEAREYHEQSCEYVKEHLGIDLDKDDVDADSVIDSLVFYWSR